uniref:SET domain-containing protein n=1 Tax=Aureoumbra lagunensis TaxID=44058 RepID=A0A7S3NK30_9STRA
MDPSKSSNEPPSSWPIGQVSFGQMTVWPDSTTANSKFRPRLPGIQVLLINEDDHPCFGERGVFATRRWRPFEIIGEYVGQIKTPDVEGGFVVALDPDEAPSQSLSLDADSYGNELRFVNDFRGVSQAPNVILSAATIQGLPTRILVCTKIIKRGEELLTDYGDDYWQALSPHSLVREDNTKSSNGNLNDDRRVLSQDSENSDDEIAVTTAFMNLDDTVFTSSIVSS